jgi:hypothetical protein
MYPGLTRIQTNCRQRQAFRAFKAVENLSDFADSKVCRMRSFRPVRLAATLTVFAIAATACEDEVTVVDDTPVEGQVTIDATNPLGFTYFTFADGGSVVSVADAQTSTDWDMAFQRFTVKLNGGVAGPGSVAGANLENNAGLDTAAVLALTQADADAAFEAVTLSDAGSVTFLEDGIAEDPNAWLNFGAMGPVADPTRAWKVRLADGDFAVLRAISFVFAPVPAATFEVRYQPSGGVLATIDTVVAPVAAGAAHLDLEAGLPVTPADCNWDVRVSTLADDLELTVNDGGACVAGTFPLAAGEDFSQMTTAADAPTYGAFLSVVSGAFPTSFDGPEGVFWYNIDGAMRLYPTFNVFLVRVGATVFKVQITDYYNATGASGFPTVRFQQLQ